MTVKKSPPKPPSMLAILQLIRKTQLAQDRRLAAVENALHLVRLDVGHGAKQRETIETLARHAERLLREKEIVMAAVDVEDLRRKVQEAAQYMSAPMEEAVFAGSTPMPPAMAIGGEPTREYVWDDANVAAAANFALQAPDLRAANGHERIPTLRTARRRYVYIGAKGDIGHSPPVWCQQHLGYCTDAETAHHKFYAAGPKNSEMDGICQSMSIGTPLTAAANGHDRPPRRPAYELCGFVATHRAGVRCGVCEWTG